MESLLILQLVVTAFLCGLSWTVQMVHYPLFARVGPNGFTAYEAEHQWRISRVVGPAMLLELGLAAMLLLLPWATRPDALVWSGFLLVVVLWLATGLLAVPCHRRLAAGFDPAVHRRLLRVNAWRTAGWTLRTLLAGSMLFTMTSTGG